MELKQMKFRIVKLILAVLFCLELSYGKGSKYKSFDSSIIHKDDVEYLLKSIDKKLKAGEQIRPGQYAVCNVDGAVVRLARPEYKTLIHQYTSTWLAQYSHLFPEVVALHLLGGGKVTDLIPYYQRSTDFVFKRICLSAFCMENISLGERKIIPEPLFEKINAKVSIILCKEGVDLEYSLINKSEKMFLLFSDRTLRPNLEIKRIDNVPVFSVPSDKFFVDQNKAFDYDPINAVRDKPYFLTALPKKSTLIRRVHIGNLQKQYVLDSATHPAYITASYERKFGSPYLILGKGVLGTRVSGEIKDFLILKIRYVYDFSLLSDYVSKIGYEKYPNKNSLSDNIKRGIYENQPKKGRIVSNWVRLVFDSTGKLKSYSEEKEAKTALKPLMIKKNNGIKDDLFDN